MSAFAPFSLIEATPHLNEALQSIHQAAVDFSSPDAAVRARGEATFLALRVSEGACDYAVFALEHSSDPFVLFQSFNLILAALPSLPATQPRPSIAHLSTLLDFLMRVAVHRGVEAERTAGPGTKGPPGARSSGPWPTYVRSRAYQVVAAVAKRILGLAMSSALASRGAEAAHVAAREQLSALGEQIAALLSVPKPWPSEPSEAAISTARVVAALGIAGALVDEMSLSSSAAAAEPQSGRLYKQAGKQRALETGSAVGLSALEHRWCKAVMQAYLLPSLLPLIFHMLVDCLPSGAHAASGTSIFRHVVPLLERLMGWQFLLVEPFAGISNERVDVGSLLLHDESGSAANGAEDSQRVFSAHPVPGDFHALLLSADIVKLLAAAYRHALQLETSPELEDRLFSSIATHRLGQTILTVASFAPAPGHALDFERQVSRAAAFVSELQGLLHAECAPSSGDGHRLMSARAKALLFLATAVNVFLGSVDPRILCAACRVQAHDVGELGRFVGALAQLTSTIFAFALRRTGHSDEEEELAPLAEECTDAALRCWLTLCSSVGNALEQGDGSPEMQTLWQALTEAVRPNVVSPYFEGRLAAALASSAEDEMSEVGEETGKDRDLYADQLITLAVLARYDAAGSLGHLAHLAEPLCATLASVADGSVQVNNEEDLARLAGTWEQVHWLALMAGHVLADDVRGETPTIPSAIASIAAQHGHPAAHLITRLGVELLHKLTSAPASAPASPQVTETLLWFNGRWAASYLLASNENPTSAALQQSFGGEAGEQLLAYLLQLLRDNLERWLSDADVVQQVAAVLAALTRSSGLKTRLLARTEFERIVEAVIFGLDALPASTHGSVIAAVVSCIYGAASGEPSSAQLAASYFQRITGAIEQRLSAVLHRPDFAAVSQRGEVLASVLTVLDMLEGLAQSAQPSSAKAIYGFIAQFFDALVGLTSAYSSRPEVSVGLLRVVKALVVSLDLDFAEPSVVTGVNIFVWRLIGALAAAPEALAPVDTASALEEDAPFEGLRLTLELLNEAMVSAANDDGDQSSWLATSLSAERTSDVALHGFSTVVPLLQSDALSVPAVRSELGRLTSNISSRFPHRLLGLGLVDANGSGARLVQSTIVALDLAFSANDSLVALGALEGVVTLADAASSMLEYAPGAQVDLVVGALDHLIASLLRSLLLEALESSLIDAHLLALRSLLLSRASRALGGPEALGRQLEHFQQHTSLAPQRHGQADTAGDADPTRRAALAAAVHELSSMTLSSAMPSANGAASNALQARTQAKEARERGAAFCAASRPAALRARGALRVR